MTTVKNPETGKLRFEWDRSSAPPGWAFKRLADYRKIHRHCNVPTNCENAKSKRPLGLLGEIVMTTFRIEEIKA
jgi:hypothetical protein